MHPSESKIKQKLSFMKHVDMFISAMKFLAYFSLGSSAAKKFRKHGKFKFKYFHTKQK